MSLTGLASLRVADMKLGDYHCAGIATLTRLTELDLRSTSVSDTGVQGLSSLLRLQCLDVTWTKATAPPAVSSLTNLRMGNCRVSVMSTCALDNKTEHLLFFKIPCQRVTWHWVS